MCWGCACLKYAWGVLGLWLFGFVMLLFIGELEQERLWFLEWVGRMFTCSHSTYRGRTSRDAAYREDSVPKATLKIKSNRYTE